MKIYIAADMEGIAGIVSPQQLIPGEALYGEGRRLLTNEVNALVQSLVDCGVDDIVVKDAHYAGLNFVLDDLHPSARYCLGGLKAEQRFAGLDASFDGAFLIGYHGMGGTLRAIRDHTMTSAHWQYVTLNGMPIGEIGLDSLLFGLYGVPVVLVTGDDKACQEASSELGDGVVTYATKAAYARHAGVIKAPQKVYADYKEVVPAALRQIGVAKPYTVCGPYELTIHFTSTDLVDARYFDGEKDKRLDGLTAVYTDTDLVRLLNRAF